MANGLRAMTSGNIHSVYYRDKFSVPFLLRCEWGNIAQLHATAHCCICRGLHACFLILSQLKKLQPLVSVGNLNCQVILQTAENSLDWSNSKFNANALQGIVFYLSSIDVVYFSTGQRCVFQGFQFIRWVIVVKQLSGKTTHILQ